MVNSQFRTNALLYWKKKKNVKRKKTIPSSAPFHWKDMGAKDGLCLNMEFKIDSSSIWRKWETKCKTERVWAKQQSSKDTLFFYEGSSLTLNIIFYIRIRYLLLPNVRGDPLVRYYPTV